MLVDTQPAAADAAADQTDAAADQIERLLAELDALDAALLATLHDRIRCAARIADVKRRKGVPMTQRQHVAHVQGHAASYAVAHGIDPEFLRRLYGQIIDETYRAETLAFADGMGE